MRLDKFLSTSGLGTRKEVKALIKKGLITVDGEIVIKDSLQIDEYKNIISFNGEKIEYHKFFYLLLNKPQGYVCATEDKRYPPVTELVSEYNFAKLFPVGRLDVDTTGVLLLTNNGALCHRLLLPKYHVDKTYYVETDYEIKNELITAFKNGIMLDGELTLPGELKILDKNKALLTIHQGKFHQVKRMFAYFGLTVIKLDRQQFAFLTYGNLKQGEYRLLSSQEIETLLTY